MSARDVSWYSIYGVLITARHIPHTRGAYAEYIMFTVIPSSLSNATPCGASDRASEQSYFLAAARFRVASASSCGGSLCTI